MRPPTSADPPRNRWVVLAFALALTAWLPAGRAPAEGKFPEYGVRDLFDRVAETSGWIRHRQVRPEDFRGLAPEQPRIQATMCTRIVPSSARVVTRPLEGDAAQRVLADVEDLAFAAYMRPECSYWGAGDDRIGEDDEEYVLQHEQVHFDLAESKARALTREAREIADRIRGVGATPEEALQDLSSLLREELALADEELDEKHNHLDKSTSGRRRPRQLDEISEGVEEELKDLAEYGDGSEDDADDAGDDYEDYADDYEDYADDYEDYADDDYADE